MKLALVVFDGLTMLDLIGFYDPMTRLKSMGFIPDLTWDFCSPVGRDHIIDSFGLRILCDSPENDLSSYDLLFVPGGFGTRSLVNNQEFICWLQTAKKVPLKVSVCTGSLLLGAAGFLKDRMATTHFDSYEELKPYCKQVLRKDIVEDNGIVTAGAVATSLKLGLHLCNKLAGTKAKMDIARRMAVDHLEL